MLVHPIETQKNDYQAEFGSLATRTLPVATRGVGWYIYGGIPMEHVSASAARGCDTQ